MRARHAKGGACRKDGGEVKAYAGGDSNVAKEAKEKDGFKKGGKVAAMHGEKAKHRLDKPHRASGGSVKGKSPFSSMHEGVPEVKGKGAGRASP